MGKSISAQLWLFKQIIFFPSRGIHGRGVLYSQNLGDFPILELFKEIAQKIAHNFWATFKKLQKKKTQKC